MTKISPLRNPTLMPEIMPSLLKTNSELRIWRKNLYSNCVVGFVPTMGALHEGHAALLRKLRPQCDKLVLSIYVNPKQFRINEDLDKYPRTLDADLLTAQEEQVDAVFFPSNSEMYPEGFSTTVTEESLSSSLCGTYRPGHFQGVTTIVLKLFNLVQPHLAAFGLKDAHQFYVLSKMVRDLNLDLKMIGVDTIREPDGLALSSRNQFLSAPDRELAPLFYKELKKISSALRNGSPIESTLNEASCHLEKTGFIPQYLDVRTLPHLAPSSEKIILSEDYLIAGAVILNGTRLIDNIRVTQRT